MRDPMNSAGVSIYNVGVENVEDRQNELSDMLNNAKIHILEQPNMGALRKERAERNKTAMKVISPAVANHVMGKGSLKKEEAAAICIQRHFRGYMGRKEYLQLLHEQFEKDEAERYEKMRQQVEDGQVLIDNYYLKQAMEENNCVRRNRRRRENCSAVTIQRVWREYSQRVHNKLVGLKNGHVVETLENGDVGHCDFNSFAVSPFEDDFYEEDLFQNHSECDEHSSRCSDEESDTEDGHASDHKAEPNHNCVIMRVSKNIDSLDLDKELPPPSTDWESIDHRLKTGGIAETSDTQYSPDPKVINRLSIGPDYLQLCFGDDNALSDGDETHEEAEIKEYVIEDRRGSKSEDEGKRDSGCILKGDELNLEPVDVKIIRPEELESTEISAEETTQVLLQLESVSEPLVDKSDKSDALRKKLERFSIRHLETQMKDLRLRIKEVSDELVRELLIRDQLHTKQDALLMDVEDAVKYAQTKHMLSKKLTK